MTDWQEYPECPYCGAIQHLDGEAIFRCCAHTCHSCDKRYELQTNLLFRTSKKED